MLNILHDKINAICPISCLYDSGDGEFRIDYIEQPTEIQLQQINVLLQGWPLEKTKLNKINQLDLDWNNQLKNGWVTPYGWSLGLKTEDVTLLSGAFILAKEAATLGINEPTFIVDTSGVPHNLTLQEMTTLMLQYGQARGALSAWYAQKLKDINDATTIEEVNNI